MMPTGNFLAVGHEPPGQGVGGDEEGGAGQGRGRQQPPVVRPHQEAHQSGAR
jgi:hypothetical protein